MKEQQPGILNKGELKDKGRRKFLQGVLAGAAAAIPGTLKVNKYLEYEKEMRELAETFSGKEEDFVSANKAATFLLNELEKQQTDSFQFNDPKQSERVAFLADFLTKHLKSGVGYQYPFKNQILNLGRYDRNGLMQILVWSDKIITTSPKENVPPIPNKNKGSDFKKVIV